MRKSLSLLLALLLCASFYAKPRIAEHVILYPSHDQHGDTVTLSGKLTFPLDKEPKGIILLPHFTISSADESPSVRPTGEADYFKDDYILVMPDYIGYGVTIDRIHPYLHGSLTAQNSVDMLFHTLPLIDSIQPSVPTDSIYIVGFSQGGATALWILKLLEEKYSHAVHVKKCFAGSGPYDVATTYDEAVRSNRINMPALIPMMVTGTSEAYDLNLQNEYFFTPVMQRNYLRHIAGKRKGITSLCFLMPSHRLSYWMTSEGMDRSQPQTKRFYEGLLRSSLVHYSIVGETDTICPDWRPEAPLFVFHSTNDDIVTVHCSEHLRRCFADAENIEWDFGKYGSHLSSSKVFFQKVCTLLSEE